MWHWIKENYRTFLWAFALAVSVWISAVRAADPDDVRALPFAVPIRVTGQDPSLVINSEIPEEVKAILQAPRSVWDVIVADSQSVRAVLDLSGLSAGEHSVELQMQIEARPSRVVSASPRVVTFTLEPLAMQTFDADLSVSGDVAVGYKIGKASLDVTQVIVSGAQSQVALAKRARVSVSLNRIRENFDQTLPVEILDEKGIKLNGVTVSPASIHVTLPVTQQGGYRDVAVKVTTSGRVASGYRLTDISVAPPIVTVFATNAQLVNDLPGIVETQALDLQNAQENISARVALNLPQGVSIVGEQTVLIQAGVSPIESSIKLVGEKVEIIGLGAGLEAQVSPATVDVIVSGPLPLLDALTRQDVRVTVDLTDLGAGTHQVAPKVEALASNVTIESILPTTIEVTINLTNAPTATRIP